MSKIGDILYKWHTAKHEARVLDEKMNKYKLQIMREMNRQDTDKITTGGFSVSRSRNTRTSVSKESLPAHVWKQYSTRCSYDSYRLVKK